jgi:hypothetical protein
MDKALKWIACAIGLHRWREVYLPYYIGRYRCSRCRTERPMRFI